MKLWPFARRSEKPASPPSHRREPALSTRSYRAAYPDRLASGFNIFGTTTRDETRREIRGLVGHSRHASHNFDLARSYEMLIRRHAIGPSGIRLQMNVRDPNGSKDTRANATVEAAWTKWGKKGSPTICGNLSWWGLECQIATGIAREGGAFIRMYEGRGYGPFGFQVEPVLFDRLDLDLTQALPGGNYIEAGIEFNQNGRVLAFHIWNKPQSEAHHGTARIRERVPAKNMIYVVVPEEIGQVLGVPRSSTALRLLNMIEGFQESAMAAANYGAAQMLFFEQENAGQQLSAAHENTPIDEIEAGTIGMLPPGVKATWSQSKYPDQAVEPFIWHMTTSAAAGLGVAPESLTGNMKNSSFVTLRAGKGEERDEWRMLQRAIYEGLHDQVFSRWLHLALLTGALALPISKFDKFNAATWRPRGWASVNPKDDANANATALANGDKSLTEICAERGRSFEDVLDERAAEVAAFQKRGLPVPEWLGVLDEGTPGDHDPPQKE
ncbi:phage portal protein [Tritonibacter litoralis]|uniref:phage portal protein n=1 Tax=Tritonibacter litoralis TaxID=2662264 RepID=UPI001290CC9A|nr:phage portal protein [Tritonibacter litoralis]